MQTSFGVNFNIEMTRWCYRQSKIVSMSLHVVMMFNVFSA